MTAPELTPWLVEGCGPDQVIEAASPEAAAQDAADRQHERRVELTWIGQGPDSAVAEYEIRGGIGEGIPRVTVRRAPDLTAFAFVDEDGTDYGTFTTSSLDAAVLAMVQDASHTSVEAAREVEPAWLDRMIERVVRVTEWTVTLKVDCTPKGWSTWCDLATPDGIASHGANDDREIWTVTARTEGAARGITLSAIETSKVDGISIVSIEPVTGYSS